MERTLTTVTILNLANTNYLNKSDECVPVTSTSTVNAKDNITENDGLHEIHKNYFDIPGGDGGNNG